jgi:hypothetical protein
MGTRRYRNKTYGSLPAAAMAASDLGVKPEALDGCVFWQIIAPPSSTAPVETIRTVRRLASRVE